MKRGGGLCIMQGYFADAYHFLPNKNTMPIYIGTHFCEFAQEFLLHLLSFDRDFFKTLEIGARDEFTMAFCDRIGLKSYLSRCLTLTLDKRDEKLEYKKVFFVNFDKKYLKFVPKDLLKNAEFINQKSNSTSNEPFLQEYWFEKAEALLNKYKNEAALIITTALHCASPCTAMGIPVVLLCENEEQRARFSALKNIIPIYNLDDLKNKKIDFNPKAPDIEDLKEAMLLNLKLNIQKAKNLSIDEALLKKTREKIATFRAF